MDRIRKAINGSWSVLVKVLAIVLFTLLCAVSGWMFTRIAEADRTFATKAELQQVSQRVDNGFDRAVAERQIIRSDIKEVLRYLRAK